MKTLKMLVVVVASIVICGAFPSCGWFTNDSSLPASGGEVELPSGEEPGGGGGGGEEVMNPLTLSYEISNAVANAVTSTMLTAMGLVIADGSAGGVSVPVTKVFDQHVIDACLPAMTVNAEGIMCDLSCALVGGRITIYITGSCIFDDFVVGDYTLRGEMEFIPGGLDGVIFLLYFDDVSGNTVVDFRILWDAAQLEVVYGETVVHIWQLTSDTTNSTIVVNADGSVSYHIIADRILFLIDGIEYDCTYPYDNPHGGWHNLASPIKSAGLPLEMECHEDNLCTDGADNDFDGLIDCMDPDCFEVPPCLPVEICDDGLDNDNDFFTDCDDTDCQVYHPELCGEMSYCDDGEDNDNDGFTDCDDPDCSCAVEIVCDDGEDNDKDGSIDCEDADCASAIACGCKTSCNKDDEVTAWPIEIPVPEMTCEEYGAAQCTFGGCCGDWICPDLGGETYVSCYVAYYFILMMTLPDDPPEGDPCAMLGMGACNNPAFDPAGAVGARLGCCTPPAE